MARPTTLDLNTIKTMFLGGATTREIGIVIGCSHAAVAYQIQKNGWSPGHTRQLCGQCGNTDPANFYPQKPGLCRGCQVSRTAAMIRSKKAILVEYKGGKCKSCGYDRCLNALEFHHLDPKEKEYTPVELKFKSLDEAKQELDKCVLVCANCHREIHAGVIECP